MEDKELIIVLKQIKSCLKHNDWFNAKEFIKVKIEKVRCREIK